jgi:sensor histidine kinase YesM
MKALKENRILYHILLWWGCWSLVTFFLTNGYGNPSIFIIKLLTTLLSLSIIIYVNLKYLLPKLFFQKKNRSFILAGLLLLVFVSLLLNSTIPFLGMVFQVDSIKYAPPLPENGHSGMKWAGQSLPFIMAFLGSTLIEITRFANQKEKQANASEKEKLNTELKFLKSQVNPHFLFNALNNIYSMALMQAPQTPESVMQLSEILRYMVYDASEEKVPLKSEINYIKNFVNLKLMKDSRGMDVVLNLDAASEQVRVAPLLLIPFVENAFKHSKIESLKTGYIKINLTTNNEWIEFNLINSIPENNFTKDKVGGIGLENTKKRLEILYPNGKHQLNIHQSHERFEVILKIALK